MASVGILINLFIYLVNSHYSYLPETPVVLLGVLFSSSSWTLLMFCANIYSSLVWKNNQVKWNAEHALFITGKQPTFNQRFGLLAMSTQ